MPYSLIKLVVFHFKIKTGLPGAIKFSLFGKYFKIDMTFKELKNYLFIAFMVHYSKARSYRYFRFQKVIPHFNINIETLSNIVQPTISSVFLAL